MSEEAVVSGLGEEVPRDYDPELYRVRHSLAHVMAEAVRDHFREEGEVHFAIGPPVDDGFYYDFELPRPVTDEELPAIEQRMRAIIDGAHPFVREEVRREDALKQFSAQPFKLELIEGLGEDEVISTYRHDDFVDLCRGPHVASTSDLRTDAFKLTSVAGAYWRGDEHRPMLQRIYGTAWRTSEELERHSELRAEAERRDHRRLGKELELFHLDPTAPGMPYWLPKGMRLLNGLLEFWREEHERRGYQEISSPLINEKRLWEVSGHWDHYKDNMFVVPVDEHTTYGVKPMNCPNAMVVYNLKIRSYRDLPLRLSDCDALHRHERSGTLHGLLRVQAFAQDDAHIFLAEDQLAEEYDRILDIADVFYELFGLTYRLRLGTRPDSFIGDVETWDKAEAALTDIIERRVGAGNYLLEPGDGAFYGPKIDIMMDDALGRSWQMGTIQLDFQLPQRFNCRYTASDGIERTPVVVHRVIYGSLERFIGILIEHTAGAFPVWLSPVQACLLPVREQHAEYAETVAQQLRGQGIRVEVDSSERRLGARIRHAQLQKTPYMLVCGDAEVEGGTVSVRTRAGEDLGPLEIGTFAERVLEQSRTRALN